MKVTLALLALFLALQTPAQAACGYAKVNLEGATVQEEAASCRSLEKAVGYFRAAGIEIEPEFKLVLEEEVLLPLQPGQTERIPVHGYFDTDTKEIHLVSFRSPKQEGRTAFNLPFDDSLAESILLHEVVHMLAIAYMGPRFKDIAHPWHEALAYSVQLELMPPELLAAIRAANPADRFDAYESKSAITGFAHGMNPDGFAMHSFTSFRNWGGPTFLKDLLDGKIPESAPREEQF